MLYAVDTQKKKMEKHPFLNKIVTSNEKWIYYEENLGKIQQPNRIYRVGIVMEFCRI